MACALTGNVESSVRWGTVTGPLDFFIFINDLPQNLTSSMELFVDIMFREVTRPEDADLLQQD